MDVLLQKVTQQAMNYAIRSGIAITSGFAINQCSRLLKTVKSEQRDELSRLQHRLDSKIRIIAPAIEMIELITARGNTSLESAVNLTKSIRWDIQSLGVRLSKAAANEEAARTGSSKAKSSEETTLELKLIIKDIKRLLDRIEDAVPFINLAITTSGVSLSTNLPPSISPSRLLQASTFLSAGDSHYSLNPSLPSQIGPRFTLSVYMLFLGHTNHAMNEEGLSKILWKEVIHKAQMKLVRVPISELQQFPFRSEKPEQSTPADVDMPREDEARTQAEISSNEFAYQLTMIEDLHDGRFHNQEDGDISPGPVDDVSSAGIRTSVPIHEIAKIFYADTGKILNLGAEGESNNPILLLKRDVNAPAPCRLMERTEAEWDLIDETDPLETDGEVSNGVTMGTHPGHSRNESTASIDHRGLPPDLDPEWLALEVNEGPDSDDESEADETEASNTSSSRPQPPVRKRSSLASALSSMRIKSTTSKDDMPVHEPSPSAKATVPNKHATQPPLLVSTPVTTSLSLLEMLIRLASLQQFQQCSHLAITDELLNFFLSEGSTTGAASGDAEARKRIRMEARQHVGFDPYDESPIKRRGEQHQVGGSFYDGASLSHHYQGSPSPALTRSPNSTSQSPLLRGIHEQTHRSPIHGGRSAPTTPAQMREQEPPFPMTPPGTSKSRHAQLRRETPGGSERGRSSPLTKQDISTPSPISSDKET